MRRPKQGEAHTLRSGGRHQCAYTHSRTQVQGKTAADVYLVFPRHYCSCQAFFFKVVNESEAVCVSVGRRACWGAAAPAGRSTLCHLPLHPPRAVQAPTCGPSGARPRPLPGGHSQRRGAGVDACVQLTPFCPVSAACGALIRCVVLPSNALLLNTLHPAAPPSSSQLRLIDHRRHASIIAARARRLSASRPPRGSPPQVQEQVRAPLQQLCRAWVLEDRGARVCRRTLPLEGGTIPHTANCCTFS